MQNDSIQLNDEDLENVSGGVCCTQETIDFLDQVIKLGNEIGNSIPTPAQIAQLKILNDEYPFQVFSYPLDPDIKRKLNKADEIFSKYWAYIE